MGISVKVWLASDEEMRELATHPAQIEPSFTRAAVHAWIHDARQLAERLKVLSAMRVGLVRLDGAADPTYAMSSGATRDAASSATRPLSPLFAARSIAVGPGNVPLPTPAQIGALAVEQRCGLLWCSFEDW
jgi:hypothetical protein